MARCFTELGTQCNPYYSRNIGWPCDLLSLTNSLASLGPHITTVNPELDRGFLLGVRTRNNDLCSAILILACGLKDPEPNKIQAEQRHIGNSHRKLEPAICLETQIWAV